MKIIFLYSEISTYNQACFCSLAKRAEIHVIKYPINKNAPFLFNKIANCVYYDRSTMSTNSIINLCQKIDPDILIISGWKDRGYIKTAKYFKRKIPVVLTMDNYWHGTLKQHLFAIISPFYLKKIFTHIWVPGKPQVEYAKRLKFNINQIKTSFYAADTTLYNQFYESNKEQKKKDFPKRFLYVGRYIAFKNMKLMSEAFIDAVEESESSWELWCIGTGDLWNERIIHSKIKHIGFVQPEKMSSYISNTGVFILPSIIDNWGVVVHEFAAAGFPLICSSGVGAASEFLIDNKNGFIFNPKDKIHLKKIFIHIMQMNSEELYQMGYMSHKMSSRITPDIWCEKVYSFVEK